MAIFTHKGHGHFDPPGPWPFQPTATYKAPRRRHREARQPVRAARRPPRTAARLAQWLRGGCLDSRVVGSNPGGALPRQRGGNWSAGGAYGPEARAAVGRAAVGRAAGGAGRRSQRRASEPCGSSGGEIGRVDEVGISPMWTNWGGGTTEISGCAGTQHSKPTSLQVACSPWIPTAWHQQT
jgi:hypothetical protein